MNEQTAVEETPAIMSEIEKRILRTVIPESEPFLSPPKPLPCPLARIPKNL